MLSKILVFFLFLALTIFNPPSAHAGYSIANGMDGYAGTRFIINAFIPGIANPTVSQRTEKNKPIYVIVQALDKNDQIDTNRIQGQNFFYMLTDPSGKKCPYYVEINTHPALGPLNRKVELGHGGYLAKGSDGIQGDLFPPQPDRTLDLGLGVRECQQAIPGRWKIDVWFRNQTPQAGDYLFQGGVIDVRDEGAGSTTISHINEKEENTTICANNLPQIVLNNANADTEYWFWWEGPITKISDFAAGPIKFNTNRTTELITLSRTGLPDDPDPRHRLCMGENLGWAWLVGHGFNDWCSKPGNSLNFTTKSGNCSLSTTPDCTPKINVVNDGENKYTVSVIGTTFPNEELRGFLFSDDGGNTLQSTVVRPNPDQGVTFQIGDSNHPVPAGSWRFNAWKKDAPEGETPYCTIPNITVSNKPGFVSSPPPAVDVCKTDRNGVKCAYSKAEPCSDNKDAPKGFQTAIGCLHTSPEVLAKDFLTFSIAISGGLAFLMMLFGAFQLLTSAGNPDTLGAGRDKITNAVIGLLIIIFATLLLQVIGVDVLKLPGFTK